MTDISTTSRAPRSLGDVVATFGDLELAFLRRVARRAAYKRHLTLTHDRAEDVVQDALLRLWAHRDRPLPENLAGYMGRTIQNLLFDRQCRKKHRQRDGQAEHPFEQDEGSLPTVGEESPEEQLIRKDFLRRQYRLWDQLFPPTTCRALYLVYVADFTHAEAARALSLTRGALNSMLMRARRRLQAHAEDSPPGDALP